MTVYRFLFSLGIECPFVLSLLKEAINTKPTAGDI